MGADQPGPSSETTPTSAPASASTPATSAATSGADRPTIVLVHGAFADASGWLPVITLLQADGFRVAAVQNSLTSLVGDLETTRRVIDAQTGPVVVVGHSYGGAVVSGAAAGAPNVRALVYLAALAPDAGEPVAAFLPQHPSDVDAALVPDAGGMLYIDPAKFPAIFAGDLPPAQARAMAVAQKPIAQSIYGESSPGAAWKTIPSWYLVAQEDRVINPELERIYASRMNARTSEIRSSHVPFLSHPGEVARLIREAAVGII